MMQQIYQTVPGRISVLDNPNNDLRTDYTLSEDWKQFPKSKKVMMIDIITKAQSEYNILEKMAHNNPNGHGEPGEWGYRMDKKFEDESEAWKILKEHFGLHHEDSYLVSTDIESRIRNAVNGKSYFGDDIATLTQCYNIFMAAVQESKKQISKGRG